MSLYASKKAVELTIRLFTDVHECQHCGRFFTEMENIGCWECKYHPGKYDHVLEKWTCCGETYRRPSFNYRSYGHLMVWNTKDKWNHIKPYSDGCTRRDCQSKRKTPIPSGTLPLDDIATLIPYMERPVNERPGLKRGPLRFVRSETRPYHIWKKAPLDV